MNDETRALLDHLRVKLNDEKVKTQDVITISAFIAQSDNYKYVTVEHIAAAVLVSPRVTEFIEEYLDADAAAIHTELFDYLENNNHNIRRDHPISSPMIKFEGTTVTLTLRDEFMKIEAKDKDNKIDPIFMLGSLLEQKETYVEYIFKKHGITVENMREAYEGKQLDDVGEIPYCQNLLKLARKDEIETLVGRDNEIEQLLVTLGRKYKSNAVLVGEPGVGKTAIIEGIAQRVSEKKVPSYMHDKEIFLLDTTQLMSGANMRGDLEKRIQHIINQVMSRNAILAIDELANIQGMGSGGLREGNDVAGMLKPALARGLQVIGATTNDEYNTVFGKNPGLARRFKKITVCEPTIDETKEIIRGLRKSYEDFHNIRIDDAVIDETVDLSMRHVHKLFNPDKSIDIIDTAASALKLAEDKKKRKKKNPALSLKNVRDQVAKLAGIDLSSVDTEENDKFKDLDKRLKQKIFGQDHAIDSIVDAILVAKAGLRDGKRPVGSFLAVGPTGSGKTELAIQLAEEMKMGFCRIDGSELSEQHAKSKLLGTSAGYVGYGDQGAIIKALDDNPETIILWDEAEKSHLSVLQVMMSAMDSGSLTSGDNKTVQFNKCIIIFTSNLGAKDAEKRSIGFDASENDGKEAYEKALKEFLPPEFRNRMDDIIRFNKLGKEQIFLIVDKFVAETNRLLSVNDRNVVIELNEDARKYFADKGFSSTMGARPMKRLIAKKLEKPISKEILYGKFSKKGGRVLVSVSGNDIKLTYKNK